MKSNVSGGFCVGTMQLQICATSGCLSQIYQGTTRPFASSCPACLCKVDTLPLHMHLNIGQYNNCIVAWIRCICISQNHVQADCSPVLHHPKATQPTLNSRPHTTLSLQTFELSLGSV